MKLCWARGEVVKIGAVAGENDEKDTTGGQPQHHCGLWLCTAGCLFASINYSAFKTWQQSSPVTNNHSPEAGQRCLLFKNALETQWGKIHTEINHVQYCI